MASYTIGTECPAVAQATGRFGVAIVNYRGHDYRVTLGARFEITVDGKPTREDLLPIVVFDYAKRNYNLLRNAHLNRAA